MEFIESYKMVYVNILLIGLTLSSILFYYYIYPKKGINLFVLLLIVSLLPLSSILRPGTYESGDLSLHAKIAMAFYESLKNGELIPRWGGLLCASYGCPDFIFMYMLPYYIVSFFHFIGFSFINSIKILLILSFLSSAIGMYLWCKELANKLGALAGSIFFIYAPYHLVNLHFRVDIAETLATAFIPLQFFAVNKILSTNNFRWILAGAIFQSLIILSHQATALGVFPLVLTYAVFTWYKQGNKKIKTLSLVFYSSSIGILLCSFFLLPIIFESKYILWGSNPSVVFPAILELLYSPWRYGFLFQGPNGELSFLIGYAQIFIVVLSIYFLFKTSQQKYLFFFILSFLFYSFMILPYSSHIWNTVPLIKSFQFSFRLLSIVIFITGTLAAITVSSIKSRKFLAILLIFAITSTLLNWGNRRVINTINDSTLSYQLLNGDPGSGDMTTPIWLPETSKIRNSVPKEKLVKLEGDAVVKQISRTNTKHNYIVNAKTNSYLRENTLYYPGWEVLINNKQTKIDYQNKKNPGVITFALPKGLHTVAVEFKDTTIRSYGKLISIATAISIILVFLYLIFIKNVAKSYKRQRRR